jgi:hypothetical protein
MSKPIDWYPKDGASERILYGNIDAKIDSYKAKYTFLTADYLNQIHTMCQSFIQAFDKIEQNRATGKQMTTWFTAIVESKQTNEPIPPAPVFQTFNMPANGTLGLEQQCRDFAGLFKKQLNYDKADGLDLMIERTKTDDKNLADSQPELKLSVANDGKVSAEWKKIGFDSLELQYRKAGLTMWQPADKSTEKIIEFTPPLTAVGSPEKFEFRAVYLIKNQRVGNWSPTYNVTVG